MSAEELAKQGLEQLESVLIEAVEFYRSHPALSGVKAAQMHYFQELVGKANKLEELQETVSNFLEKQAKREQRGALSGWALVAQDILGGLNNLGVNQSVAAQRQLKKIARWLKDKGFKTISGEVEMFLSLPERQKELLKVRQQELHFRLAHAFFRALHQLYRGKDILAEARTSGRPFCRSLEG